MCALCFLVLLFLIYAIIGIIAGSIFNYKYKWKVDLYKYTWKVDLNVSPEKFGLCWPKYVPILISELKDEKKQSNRNIVLATLDDIEYDKINSSEKSNSNINTGLFTSLGLTAAYLALNKELIESIKPNGYLEFKGKQYMVDINGNILPLNLN
jgi:hypothetical protein